MLTGRSMTDEEYRSHEQHLNVLVAEAERILAILNEVSEAVGDVTAPSIVLRGLAQVNLPLRWYAKRFYSRDGKSDGFVFGLVVFHHQELADRYNTISEGIDALYKRHAPGTVDVDPAFETIRHLENDWWGRRPVRNTAYPDAFAVALIEKHPVGPNPKAENDPKMIVRNEKVYIKTDFRMYDDGEAVVSGESPYIEDDDMVIIAGPTNSEGELPKISFGLQGWIDQPFNVRGWDKEWNRKWYQVNYEPLVEAGDDDARRERLANAYRTAVGGQRVILTKNTTASGTIEDTRNLHGDGVVIGWLDGDVLQPDAFASDEDSFVDQMFRKGIDVAGEAQ